MVGLLLGFAQSSQQKSESASGRTSVLKTKIAVRLNRKVVDQFGVREAQGLVELSVVAPDAGVNFRIKQTAPPPALAQATLA
jgi:hypothetical protein